MPPRYAARSSFATSPFTAVPLHHRPGVEPVGRQTTGREHQGSAVDGALHGIAPACEWLASKISAIVQAVEHHEHGRSGVYLGRWGGGYWNCDTRSSSNTHTSPSRMEALRGQAVDGGGDVVKPLRWSTAAERAAHP